jgi:hypothetical protein
MPQYIRLLSLSWTFLSLATYCFKLALSYCEWEHGESGQVSPRKPGKTAVCAVAGLANMMAEILSNELVLARVTAIGQSW